MNVGAAALVVVAWCSWAEPVAWCCPVTMAVWAAWWQGCGVRWRGVFAGVKTYSILGRTGGGVACYLLEGVVVALTGHRVAPGETLTPGSGGGDALAS